MAFYHHASLGRRTANKYGVDYTNEVVKLKVQLALEQTEAEGLAADVMHLSLQLRQATRACNGLDHAYKPMLRNIESSLAKMKYDNALLVKCICCDRC